MSEPRSYKFFSMLDESYLPLLSDGAMGTMLNARNIGFEQCFDALNLSHPALVGEIHRAYIDAGAQIIQTNTFGANRFKLALHNLDEQVVQLNQAGVELARRVQMASFKDVLVAGDIGPLGVRLAPYGRVQPAHPGKFTNAFPIGGGPPDPFSTDPGDHRFIREYRRRGP